MGKYLKTGVVKALMILLTFAAALGANAENKLYVEGVTLNSTTPKKVAVILDNSDPVAAVQCDFHTPDGVIILDGFERNDQRFAAGQTSKLIVKGQDARLVVISGGRVNFNGNSGAIGYITIQATQAALDKGLNGKITVDGIVLSSTTGQQVPAASATTSANLSVQDGIATLSTSEPFVINPGGQQTVSLMLDHNFSVNGIQTDIVLPEGFSIIGEVNKGERVSNGAFVTTTNRGNGVYNVQIYDLMSVESILSGNSGEILNFTVQAPDNFTAGTAQITFNKVVLSKTEGKGAYYPDAVSLTVTNGKIAHDRALAEVKSLEDSLAEALATIAEKCPDVKDLFPGTEISNSIEALKSDIETAYDNLTLTDNYDNVMEPVQDIRDAIAKLVVDAVSAQEEFLAAKERQEYLDRANTEIAALETQLNAALATIAETCPNVKDKFNGANIASQISALKDAVNAAFENKTIVENYDNLMAPVSTIKSEIEKLITDAQAAQKAYEEQAALDQARQNANTAIAGLEKALADALATIAQTCPDVKQNFTGSDITAQIAVLRNAVNEAYENKTLATNYDEVMAPATAITDAIAKLLTDAQAAQKAYEDAQAALQAAYTKANAKVDELTNALNTALATIAETCPNVKDNFKGTAITEDIAKLKAAVDKAYTDKTLTATYDQVMTPAAAIEAAIAKLLSDAQAAQKAYEEQAALDQARQNANTAIAGLEKALADALATIAQTCPDVKQNFTGSDITAQIAVLRNAVNEAYENKTLATNYDEVMAPATAISEAIAKLITDAQAAQKKFNDDAAAEAADQEAYKNAKTRLDELKEALETAIATIAETCPDVKDNFKGDDIDKQIDNLEDAVKDAYDDRTIAENYDKVIAPAADIDAAIEKLVTDAQAAQKAFTEAKEAEEARQAANKEAYDTTIEGLDALQVQLDKAVEDALAFYPDFAVDTDRNAAQAAIDAAKEAAKKAYDAVAAEGTYEYTPDTEAITALINVIVPHAALAKADNEIKGLDEAFDAAIATIAKDCPDVKDNFPGTEIKEMISNLETAVENADKQGTLYNDYDTVMEPVAAIKDAIEKLIADAKDAQKAEEDRQAANYDAYVKDLETIEGLEKKLDEAIDQIKTIAPLYDYESEKEAILEAIKAQRDKADKAYEDVAEEGTYENEVDVEAVEALIKDMLKNAEDSIHTGITEILGEELNENDKIYTIEGVRIAEPIRGKINIVVRANGEIQKVLVK